MENSEWQARINHYIKSENEKIGKILPIYRIYCQDDRDRSGGGLYNQTVTIDTIGRFARALGDSNPLYTNPLYAKKSQWRGIIAPPLLESCIVSTFIKGEYPRVPGIKIYDAGTKWERWEQIRPDDSFWAENRYLGIEEISRPESENRILMRRHSITLMNSKDQRVATLTARTIIKCLSPEKSKSEKKSKAVEKRPHYSEKILKQLYHNLDQQFDGDFRRGAIPRYWEDVEIGEKISEEWIGPYDESDGISLMAAIGVSNAFSTKWGALRKWKAHGIIDPQTGAYRNPIDRHATDLIAQTEGSKRAIAYGIHNQAIIAKTISDWMGDQGFLKVLDCHCRRALYYGDLSIQSGVVVGKLTNGKEHLIELDMKATRQDGVVHTNAEAIVSLPSREA